MSALVDARTLSRLKWRCRRGLLENDLFVERFFAGRGDAVTVEQASGLGVLMDLPDNDLLDLLLRRTEPQGDLQRDDVLHVLALMRSAPKGIRSPDEDDGPLRARAVETNPPSVTHPLTEESP